MNNVFYLFIFYNEQIYFYFIKNKEEIIISLRNLGKLDIVDWYAINIESYVQKLSTIYVRDFLFLIKYLK